jgi:mannose-6-phosphate isomerase-like protein (cupin superfamily)
MHESTSKASATARDGEDGAAEQLGDRLRRIRMERGISQREAAKRSEVTPSFLSAVERNQTAPSLTTLLRICHALGINLIEAVAPSGTHGSVVRADQRSRLTTEGKEVEIEVLVDEAGRPFEMFLCSMPPKAATAPALRSHDNKEALFVISGQARLEIGDSSEDLGPGDTIYFSSEVPHRVVNVGRGELKFVSCIAGKF